MRRIRFFSVFFIIFSCSSSSLFGAMPIHQPALRSLGEGVPEKLIVLIIPSYNNVDRFKRNIDSVLCQKYSNYRVIYIDDCSTDGMSDLVPTYIKEHDPEMRWMYIRNPVNQGAMYNIYHAIHACPDNAIIITLDGDDYFKHERALARINREYADESIWLTYGQFEWLSSGDVGYCRTLSPAIRNNLKLLRNNCGYATAPRTFYAWLFKKIKKEDLMYQGRFFPAAWDRAMMAPMLEMASPNHFRCIYDVLYVYDNNTTLNDHTVRFELQWDLGASVFAKPNYKPLDRSEADKQKRIVIITASYKNAEWYLWNLESVVEQNYENWHLIYVDDCSPDGTGQLVEEYIRMRDLSANVTLIHNETRKKALANLYTAIHMCKPDDIIVLLDGDDRFAHRNVLKEVNRMYTEHDVWLTYGQFRRFPDGTMGWCCPMPEEIIENNAFREFPTPPSHLRTFYAGLFHKIKREDLMYNGDFYPITYDLAIMYPMIEMARDHFMFCSIPMLEYNVANPINDHKVNYDLQLECDRLIRAGKRYDKINSPF